MHLPHLKARMQCREMEQRKQGGRGRSIRDDPSRYPDKVDVGILREPPPPPHHPPTTLR